MLYLTINNAMNLHDNGEELKHSLTTTSMGTTRQYSRKYSTQDTWSSRVALLDRCNVFSCVEFDNEVDPTKNPNTE
jgi:hypothetical protein